MKYLFFLFIGLFFANFCYCQEHNDERTKFDGFPTSYIGDEFLSISSLNTRYDLVSYMDDSIVKNELEKHDEVYKKLFYDCEYGNPDIKDLYYLNFIKKSNIKVSFSDKKINSINKGPKIKPDLKFNLQEKGLEILISNTNTYNTYESYIYYRYKFKKNYSDCSDRVFMDSFVNKKEIEIIKTNENTNYITTSRLINNDAIEITNGKDVIATIDRNGFINLDTYLKNLIEDNVTIYALCNFCKIDKYEFLLDVSEYKKFNKIYKNKLKLEKDKEKAKLIEIEKERVLKEREEKQKRDNELKAKLKPYKNQCKELGFNEGSKKFKDCVVELME